MKLAIYVPTYDAATTVEEVITRTATVAAGLGASVLVQDDGSTDGTVALARRAAAGLPHVEVSANPANLGYGGNLKSAATRLSDGGADAIAMLHGDLQYRPEDLPRLLEPITAGRADLTLGSRIDGHPVQGGMPRYKWLGNRVLTGAINLRLGVRLTDPHTGLVAFTTSAGRAIDLRTCRDGHEISADMCIRALARGLRIEEVPVPTSYGPGSRSCSAATSFRYGAYLLRSLASRDARRSKGPGTAPTETAATPT